MPQLELTLPAIVLIPFAAAALALWLGRFAGQRTGILTVLAALTSFAGCLQVATAGTTVGFAREWIPGINVALILLFVFWEITSITSYLLIGYWYEQESARQGALTALLVTALGGLAMLAGFVLIGLATGFQPGRGRDEVRGRWWPRPCSFPPWRSCSSVRSPSLRRFRSTSGCRGRWSRRRRSRRTCTPRRW